MRLAFWPPALRRPDIAKFLRHHASVATELHRHDRCVRFLQSCSDALQIAACRTYTAFDALLAGGSTFGNRDDKDFNISASTHSVVDLLEVSLLSQGPACSNLRVYLHPYRVCLMVAGEKQPVAVLSGGIHPTARRHVQPDYQAWYLLSQTQPVHELSLCQVRLPLGHTQKDQHTQQTHTIGHTHNTA